MSKNRVVVTGIGIMTPLGNDPYQVWDRILRGESSANLWPDLQKEGFRYAHACRIKGLPNHPLSRGMKLTLDTAKLTFLSSHQTPPEKTGIYIGSTIGESGAFEEAALDKNIQFMQHTAASFARGIQKKYKLSGTVRVYGAACAAGNYAIGAAAEAISRGRIDVALAGGVEPFSRIAMAGFSRSRAMTPEGICRPFDKHRSGMLLGEGAGFVYLEKASNVLQDGREPLAEIESLGLSCDAYHLTRPDPEGNGMAQSMRESLKSAEVLPENVDWICAHGTGTLNSDASEARAINKIFGNSIPVSGLKGALGHSLGAATAIETVLCILSLKQQVIPPMVNLKNLDTEFSIHPVYEPTPRPITRVLNCGYAFGGINSALMISKWK